jgi:hypothetical protein
MATTTVPAETSPESRAQQQVEDLKNDAAHTHEDLKASAQQAAESAKAKLNEQGERLRRKADEVQKSAGERANQAKRYVQDKAREQARIRQNKVETGIRDAVSAARSASETLKQKDDTAVAGVIDSVANKAEGVANYLGNSEPGDLLDDGRAFARRYPELTLGGMFLVGLAAARFFKSSEIERDSDEQLPARVPVGGDPAQLRRPPASPTATASPAERYTTN